MKNLAMILYGSRFFLFASAFSFTKKEKETMI